MVKVLSRFAEPVVNVNEVSRITEGVEVTGTIISPTDIRIDGKVDGIIKSEGRVVVGESAEIKGSIFCNILDFWGKMDGDIFVRDTLSLKSVSNTKGSIHVRRLQAELGAQIDGSCQMITEEQYDNLFNK